MKRIPQIFLLAALAISLGCEKPVEPAPGGSAVPTKAERAAAKKEAAKAEEAKAQPQGDKPTAPADPSETWDGMGVGATPADIEEGKENMYGKKSFASAVEPISLKAALERAAQGEGPYKVATNIEKVCQVKGCWFTLKEPGVSIPIRVRMKDYKFFVPKNAGGMPVVAEGTLRKTTISQEMAQHYADDEAKATGKPAKTITGPQQTYEFTATAVKIRSESKG